MTVDRTEGAAITLKSLKECDRCYALLMPDRVDEHMLWHSELERELAEIDTVIG